MSRQHDLPKPEQERARLYSDLSKVGDFRPGTLAAVMRKCGRANCACSDPEHPGHGPQHMLTKKVAGKTVAKHVQVGPELDKVAREVAGYKRFKGIVEQLVQVSEQICETRPITASVDSGDGDEKRGRSVRRSRPRSRKQ